MCTVTPDCIDVIGDLVFFSLPTKMIVLHFGTSLGELFPKETKMLFHVQTLSIFQHVRAQEFNFKKYFTPGGVQICPRSKQVIVTQ